MDNEGFYTWQVDQAERRIRKAVPDAIFSRTDFGFALAAANAHEAPEVTYRHGWFAIRNSGAWLGTKHRRKEIEAFRDRLLLRAQEKA